MNFYSHKWIENNSENYRLLRDHLKQVGENSYNSVRNIYLKKKDEFFEKSALIVGILHDFGKYTEFFQEYLINGKINGPKSHAFISSLYAAYCAKQNNFPDEYIIYIYLTVKHHHGNLCNLDSDIGIPLPPLDQKILDNISILKMQVYNINKNKDEIKKDMHQIFDFAKNYSINLNFIDEFINNYNDIFTYLIYINRRIQSGSKPSINICFTDFLLLYSSLIDNDKRNAAAIDTFNRKKLDNSLIERYRDKNFTISTPLNDIRNDMYRTIKCNMENVNIEKHFYTITSPTGSGKTIAGISASLILRDKLYNKLNKLYRIIYTLPFTTIVDQNYSVMNNILMDELGDEFKDNHERYILKHHHLSLSTQTIEGKELSVDKGLMLTEDWDSEIIFTTFVQLFGALAGFKNKNLKKYFRIANSIIILDEIQSINIEKWENIRLLMKIYAEKLNIYFIIMTATQPNIIPNAIELSGDFKSRFDKLNRVIMYIDLKLRKPELIIDKYIDYNYKSILFMFNTISTSITAYKHLIENIFMNTAIALKSSTAEYKHLTGDKRKIYYISSNIIPAQRNKIMKDINKSIENNESIAVISTQIFEAGVDVNFDAVVRDIAPIDSLIQSSGRVNRNGDHNEGHLHVVNCSPENNGYDGYYCKKIYGKLHTDISLNILKNVDFIKEKDYLDVIKRYYTEVKLHYNFSSSNLDNALKNLMFHSKVKSGTNYYVSDFTILDGLDKYISVFIEINEKATVILDKYINRGKIKYDDIDIISIRREIYNYIISVRENDLKHIVCDKIYEDFYVVRKNYLENSYNNEIGLVKEEGAIEI
jgi:CRISPR-associated endonuclease/helicase Cas3